MNLRSGAPYWLLRHGLISNYPSLQQNINTDIVIMGAGISGALVAWECCQAGLQVAVVDRRHAGTGSTSASTALLQYEIDTPLHKLVHLVGKKHATKSYLLCRDAIYRLQDICRQLPDTGLFAPKPSLQYASYKKHVSDLREEYRLRKEAGIELQWLEEEDISARFGFTRPAGLLSRDGAEADAYRITHNVLKACCQKGLQVYDNTEITRIQHRKRSVCLETGNGYKISARKLVIACGYESQQYIPRKVQELHSTYAIASEPFAQKDFWYRNALIWETATPYLYLRTTSDNRIIIGGRDIEFTNPLKRDRMLSAKSRELEKAAKKLFPSIPFKTDFAWAGNFAGTKDGLPYIGTIPQRPHTWFSLGFGGNGITFSIIGAAIIRDALLGKKNRDAEIFSFDR